MLKHKLTEQGRIVEAAGSDASVFDVTIITEGEGSTGFYSREMLEANSGAFPKGTKSFIDHPKDPGKPWERSLTNIAGKFVDDARFVVEDGVGMLKSRLKVDSRWQQFVEDYKDVIGLSIYISAFGEMDDETGKVVVEGFDSSDPYASVDLVVAAGRGGRFDNAVECYRRIESSLGESLEDKGQVTSVPDLNPSKKDFQMEIEELAGKVDKLAEALQGFIGSVSPLLESLKVSEEVVEPEAVETVDVEAVTEALITAGLTKRGRKTVLAAVREGAAVEAAIAEAKADEDEFRSELRVQEGYVTPGSSFTGDVTELGKVFG